MTVQKFLLEQELRHRRPSTIYSDRIILNKLDAWKSIDTCTADDLRAYIIEYKKQFKEANGRDPQESNINIHYSVFKKYFEFMERPAVVEWITTKRIVKKLNPNKLLTPAEIQNMIRLWDNSRDKAFLAMMYETGMRRGELISLRREDVVIKDGECKIRIPDNSEGADIQAKTGSRSLVMIEYLEYIEKYLSLFPGKPTDRLFPIKRSRAGQIITKMAAKAGIEKRVYPHLLRHTRATELARAGMQETSMKKRFGWTEDSSQIKRYTSLTDEDADEAYRMALGIVDEKKKRSDKLKHCAKCGKVIIEGEYCPQCLEIQRLSEANTKSKFENDTLRQEMEEMKRQMELITTALRVKGQV
jgi:integrase